jgi:hypothetical protein
MNQKNTLIILAVIVAILAIVGMNMNPGTPGSVTNVDPMAPAGEPAYNQSISDGTITVPYSSTEFGLATNQTQILATSYIPPCDPTFNYCLYYIGTAFKGTNFESAGLRVSKIVADTEATCLKQPPLGFADSVKPTAATSTPNYSSSTFASIGNAGAGHYAEGDIYRLYTKAEKSCYEFETRIGETQYANYPEGTIKEFTVANRSDVESRLTDMIQNVSLKSGEKALFPKI